MQQRLGFDGKDGVVPLVRNAGHRSPPLGCDYRCYGLPSNLRWEEIRRRLQAGGEELASIMSWINGALTGLNMALHDTFDISPYSAEDILPVLVLEMCESNPDWPLHAAILELAHVFAPFRARTDAQSVVLMIDSQRLRMRQPALRLLQSALAVRGFLPQTAVGGRDGELLRKALLAFQHSEDLPLSGLPDLPTFSRLMQPPSRVGGA